MAATKQILVRLPKTSRYESPLAILLSMLLATGILALSGCASEPFVSKIKTSATHLADQLVPFTSCRDALRHLRTAASSAMTAGFAVSRSPGAVGGPASAESPAGSAGQAPAARPAPAAGLPGAAGQAGADSGASSAAAGRIAAPGSYSRTNTATAGVDEPDLVKTDGRRIVTVIGGVLRVVDAQTMRLTGVLDLAGWAGTDGAAPANLLLAGNQRWSCSTRPIRSPNRPSPGCLAPRRAPRAHRPRSPDRTSC
jgi:Beta propeller domain